MTEPAKLGESLPEVTDTPGSPSDSERGFIEWMEQLLPDAVPPEAAPADVEGEMPPPDR